MLRRCLHIAAVLSASVLLPLSAVRSHGEEGHIPHGPDGEFLTVFSDEFDGDSLNLDNWTTCYWWDKNGCTNLSNKELQWYMPENVTVADGKLILTARPEEVVGWEGALFPYTSGLITTGRYYAEDPSEIRFEAVEGVFEMRAKLPSGQGLWPAFWMLPSSRESKPEIDIMEMLGHRPDVLEMHFHYRNDNGDSRSVGHEVKTSDMSRDWHIYGVEWRPGAIVWYFDGKEVWRYTDQKRIPQEPMYMILNLAVGGNWPGSPDETTVFPARMEVDYVRAWTRIR